MGFINEQTNQNVLSSLQLVMNRVVAVKHPPYTILVQTIFSGYLGSLRSFLFV